MKTIGQLPLDKVEISLNELRDKTVENYIVDKEVYGHFLYEIYEKQFEQFVLRKTKNTRAQIVQKHFSSQQIKGIFSSSNKKERNAFKVGEHFAWIRATSKYQKEFHKQRPKYYLYKDEIYSYTYMGADNVGAVVQIQKYDNNDLVPILNKLTKKSKYGK